METVHEGQHSEATSSTCSWNDRPYACQVQETDTRETSSGDARGYRKAAVERLGESCVWSLLRRNEKEMMGGLKQVLCSRILLVNQ